MLRKYKIESGKIVDSSDDKGQVLVFINPDENEVRDLVDNYRIDEHTLNSALDPDELSWLEFEPTHTVIIFKRPKNYSAKDQLLFKPTTTGLFLFNDRLIIILTEDINVFEGKIFTKVSSLAEIVLKLMYSSIFHFLRHLRVINMISDELEQKINKSMENKYLLNLFTLQKSLVYYLNAINSNTALIEKIKLNTAKFVFKQEELELIEDIVLENNQCYRQAEIYSDILASLMDARVSIVSNNLNILIKTLNIITIGIMVPTLVVSIFSMNVRLPMQTFPYAFWVIVGLSTISAFIVWGIWKRKKL